MVLTAGRRAGADDVEAKRQDEGRMMTPGIDAGQRHRRDHEGSSTYCVMPMTTPAASDEFDCAKPGRAGFELVTPESCRGRPRRGGEPRRSAPEGTSTQRMSASRTFLRRWSWHQA
ncbi:hypothetical protein FQR65_LT20949 [Abscondita terminalis]|nr:hypothetical protein FQR65_LT20949 [Abscondita terminalis]